MPEPILQSGELTETTTSEESLSPPLPVENPVPAETQLDPNSVEAPDFNNVDEAPQGNAPADKTNTVGAATDALRKILNGTSEASRPVGAPNPNQVQRNRDYSGIPQEHVPLFKKMGDASFAFFKPIYQEHKKLQEENKKLKTDFEAASKSSIYDREDAYELMPEYRHASKNIQILNGEINHWQEQLISIRNGGKIKPLVGYDEQTGEPKFGPEIDPTPQHEALIINMLTRGHVLMGEVRGKMENIKSSFGNDYKSFVNKMSEIEDEIFPGADKEVLNKVAEKKLTAFPSHMRHNPVVRGLAKALAVIDGLNLMLNDAKASSSTQTLKQKTVQNAGPRSGILQTSGGRAGGKVGDVLKEFNEAKAKGMF